MFAFLLFFFLRNVQAIQMHVDVCTCVCMCTKIPVHIVSIVSIIRSPEFQALRLNSPSRFKNPKNAHNDLLVT